MIRFSAGAAAVYGAMLLFGLAFGWPWLGGAAGEIAEYAVLLLVLPTLGAYGAADAVHALRPRRVFDERVAAPWVRFFAGSGAGAVGWVLIGAAQLLPGGVPDAVVCAAGGLVGGAVVALGLGRVRAGRCIHCEYDLRGAGARCPECGRVSVAAA